MVNFTVSALAVQWCFQFLSNKKITAALNTFSAATSTITKVICFLPHPSRLQLLYKFDLLNVFFNPSSKFFFKMCGRNSTFFNPPYIQSAERTHSLLHWFVCSISGFHLLTLWRSGCSSEIKLWRLRRSLSSQAWTRTSRTKGCQSPVSKTPWCLTAAVRRTMDPCRSRTASRSTGSAAFQHCISVCLCTCLFSPAVKSRLRPSQRLSLLQ